MTNVYLYVCIPAPEKRGESRRDESLSVIEITLAELRSAFRMPERLFVSRRRSQVRGDKTRVRVVEQVRQWDDPDVYGAITASEVDWPCGNDPPANWNESYRSRLQPACIHLLVAATEAIDCERAFVWERIVRMKGNYDCTAGYVQKRRRTMLAPRCYEHLYANVMLTRVRT